MAGYLMTLDSVESLKECIETGVYSTRFASAPNGYWSVAAEGTFADYSSMSPGDSIFFFIKRKIYGIGKLVLIGDDCKYLNYIHAGEPLSVSEEDYSASRPLLKNGSPNHRCVCFFKPAPFFFEQSVDMDEALMSAPEVFRVLRTIWKLSFIKLDDSETKALADVILRKNVKSLREGTGVFPFDERVHHDIASRLTDGHVMRPYRLVARTATGPVIGHEMALEAYLCSILCKENDTPFGRWDYISHQVAASPFKPIDYMDKIDVFGYRYIEGFETVEKYLVVEIKKDSASLDAIDQIMKYVDWVNQEYTHGDYSMIDAYIVAFDFPKAVIDKRNHECIRNYVKGYRPSIAAKWENLKLVKYQFYDDGIDFLETL